MRSSKPVWLFIHCWGSTKCYGQLNISSACGQAVVLPNIYPKEVKMYVHTKACTWIFTAALFIAAKT
jgi:hypothetical protein